MRREHESGGSSPIGAPEFVARGTSPTTSVHPARASGSPYEMHTHLLPVTFYLMVPRLQHLPRYHGWWSWGGPNSMVHLLGRTVSVLRGLADSTRLSGLKNLDSGEASPRHRIHPKPGGTRNSIPHTLHFPTRIGSDSTIFPHTPQLRSSAPQELPRGRVLQAGRAPVDRSSHSVDRRVSETELLGDGAAWEEGGGCL